MLVIAAGDGDTLNDLRRATSTFAAQGAWRLPCVADAAQPGLSLCAASATFQLGSP